MSGGMGQLLIVCPALAEDPNLVHSIHTGISQKSSSRGSATLLRMLWTPVCMVVHIPSHVHIFKRKISLCKNKTINIFVLLWNLNLYYLGIIISHNCSSPKRTF